MISQASERKITDRYLVVASRWAPNVGKKKRKERKLNLATPSTVLFGRTRKDRADIRAAPNRKDMNNSNACRMNRDLVVGSVEWFDFVYSLQILLL